ncbi:helicase-related protein [Sulfurihydrogenibium sp.]|uniref:helicase-related protein n=1 Tax=Sulfurihydrogenibium sp. TaxID=2053621 RepID=UPI00261E711C|nr:helicase-related protein [Sulfurihydrogenibium sp.]
MFITNDDEKNLEKRLKELIQYSSELNFLVGFFYFSGIHALYETLKDLDDKGKLKEEFLKVLVGLNVDTANYGIYEYAKYSDRINHSEIKNEFLQSIERAFTSKELDKKEFYQQVEFFKKLLAEGKIIIRKTRHPNHSKLYIFTMNDPTVLKGFFITGSSNLTLAGLRSQNEFNVEIKDYGFKEAKKYFDELWDKAIEIDKKDVLSVIENKTFFREITPYMAYVYILKTYLESHEGKYKTDELIKLLESKGYKAYDYQLSAVSQAVSTIGLHSGVIIADVVGLGKTVIASLIAKALGKRGIVIAPPHLTGDDNEKYGWTKYIKDFKLHDWKVFSSGKLKDAFEYVKNNPDIQVVIVDEAHRFRNEDTVSYHYLKEICRGKSVILLSATPFNNRPSDIFSLLKLFTVPKKSTIVYDEDLERRFNRYKSLFHKLFYIVKYHNHKGKSQKRALRYYKEIFGEEVKAITDNELKKVEQESKRLAKEIKSIISPVLIRRNRLDLKYYADSEHIEYPVVKDPIEAFFELTHEQNDFYDEVIHAFSPSGAGGKFKGAAYVPSLYEKGITQEHFEEELESMEEDKKLKGEESFLVLYQKNLYDFMRRLLVKRFESSVGAFYQTLENFIQVFQSALDFAKRTGKFILDRKLMDDLYDEEDEEKILEELKKYQEEIKEGKKNPEYYKIYDINNFKFKDKFLQDIQSDINLFKYFKERIEDLNFLNDDPKVKELIKVIKDYIEKGRKIVIFTEYRDTARYLKPILEKEFKDQVLTVIDNINNNILQELSNNFDAQVVLKNKNEEEFKNKKMTQIGKYNILLTTDRLSEGFNLNMAGVIINYDIPWNPVRVIQRVGRINRIGKKVYDEIYIVNFFPTEKGADYVKSRQIAQTKMFMIHNVLGEDAKIFSPDEKPEPSKLYKKLNTLPDEGEEESFITKVRKEYEEIKKKDPQVIKHLQELPKRIKVAKESDKNELIVFIQKGKDIFIGYKDYSERFPKIITFEEAIDKVKADKNQKPLKWTDEAWEHYGQILEKNQFYLERGGKPKDSIESAIRTLTLIKDSKKQEIEPYKLFIDALIKDLITYRTLSQYIIKRISNIEKYIGKNTEKIISSLEEIKQEIGEDFLDKINKDILDQEESVVIAVENIKT